MRFDFDQLNAFLAVAEAGSVTAAARRLGVAKSVVSKRLADLEAAMGVALLRRSTRAVTPTDAGAAFYARARQLLADLESAVDEAQGADGPLTGSLRIAAPMSFGRLYLAPVLIAFADAHRQLELAVDCDDRRVDVAGGGYDLAVRIGRLPDSALMGKRLARSQRVLCASPGYLAIHGAPASLDAIPAHVCIGYSNMSATHLWEFAGPAPGDPPRTLAVKARVHINNGEIIRDAAIAGLGLCIQPLFMVSEALRSGALVRVLPDHPPTDDTLWAVWPAARQTARKVRLFADALAEAFAGTPPWER